MPNCIKCGKEFSTRGIGVHQQWCKGTNAVTETEDSPEIETAKKILAPPKKKKTVSIPTPEEEEEEEEEQDPEEYAAQQTNPLWYLLVLLPLALIGYLWYKLRGTEEQ